MAYLTEADLDDFAFYQDNETESLNSDSDSNRKPTGSYFRNVSFCHTDALENSFSSGPVKKILAGNFLFRGRLFERSIGNFGHFVHFRRHGVKIFKRHKPIFCL